MTNDQVHRYARHILLPDVGGMGQAQLLAACARIDGEDPASGIAAAYLAAAGVGALSTTRSVRETLVDHNPDTRLTDGPGVPIALPPRPVWWPAGGDTAAALAWWQGAVAATRWLADACAR